jgi:hypothetical protein
LRGARPRQRPECKQDQEKDNASGKNESSMHDSSSTDEMVKMMAIGHQTKEMRPDSTRHIPEARHPTIA